MVCVEADWKALVCTLSIICRARVKLNRVQLLPQQTLLLIPAAGCGEWNASAGRGTATPEEGLTSALPALKRFLSVSLDLDVQIYTRTWGSLYWPSGMGPWSSPIAKLSLQPGMLGRVPCFSRYKLWGLGKNETQGAEALKRKCRALQHLQDMWSKLAILIASPWPKYLTCLNAPTLVTGMSFLAIPRMGAHQNVSHNPLAL